MTNPLSFSRYNTTQLLSSMLILSNVILVLSNKLGYHIHKNKSVSIIELAYYVITIICDIDTIICDIVSSY
jgi:hypothetical protein